METVAFTDGGYLDRRFGFAAGFDRYDDWVLDAGRWTALGLPRGGARDPQPGSARGIAFRPEGAVRSEPSTFGSALGYVE